ncbi:MAG: hypothetical protein WC505_07350, partial [Patescibacteria group bacterium]
RRSKERSERAAIRGYSHANLDRALIRAPSLFLRVKCCLHGNYTISMHRLLEENKRTTIVRVANGRLPDNLRTQIKRRHHSQHAAM